MTNLDPEEYKNGEKIGESTGLVPVPKVAAAGIAGAVTVVIVFIVQTAFPDFEIPETVVAAVTAIIAFGAGYIKRS